MSKHTQGPWEVVGFDATPGVYYIDQSGDTGRPNVAKVMRDSGLGDAVNGANARLIAAAPDLLEFAKMVSAGVAEEGAFTVKVGTPADKILQAIIAKAEGRS